VYGDVSLTYGELNAHANQVARYLHEHYDIRPDDLVGIRLERSEWMIIAILAVLKADGAYLPLDLAYPLERLAYMVDDCRCKVTIDDAELARIVAAKDAYAPNNLPVSASPSHLAYVMYTSGTTGRPKGVLIEQAGVVRLVKSANYVTSTNKPCCFRRAP
jgi:non-ribosomal peptide synthetase component F